MKINASHRLTGPDGRVVPSYDTPNRGGNFGSGKPDFLIIHYTAGGTADGAISWFRNPAAKASAHLVIDHNGAITQLAPFNIVTWHAGKSLWGGISGLNSYSIGIEIVNWGLLKGGPGNWKSYTGTSVPDSRVIAARHKNFEPSVVHGWEIFDEAQFGATVAAAQAIVAKYGIPAANVLGHDDISPGRKQDPGPAFAMDRFKGLVFGRASDDGIMMMVRSATGLNLRAGPGTGQPVLVNLPDGTLVRPMGSDGAWIQVTALDSSGNDDRTGWVHGNWLIDA